MSPSAASSNLEDETPKRPSTHVPAWVPISAFIGTSLALAIPLVVLRRQRARILQISLKDNNSPPPRRALPSSFRRPALLSSPTPSNPSPAVQHILSTDPDKVSVNLTSGLSHLNPSSAILAAKAFAIATGIVAIGATGLVWSVKEALGVKDAREFGISMRLLLLSIVPSLSSAINRPPRTEEEHQETHLISVVEDWKWEDAEKRLKRAYDEGGISLWGQMALRELEAEARLEREKRDEEMKSTR